MVNCEMINTNPRWDYVYLVLHSHVRHTLRQLLVSRYTRCRRSNERIILTTIKSSTICKTCFVQTVNIGASVICAWTTMDVIKTCTFVKSRTFLYVKESICVIRRGVGVGRWRAARISSTPHYSRNWNNSDNAYQAIGWFKNHSPSFLSNKQYTSIWITE